MYADLKVILFQLIGINQFNLFYASADDNSELISNVIDPVDAQTIARMHGSAMQYQGRLVFPMRTRDFRPPVKFKPLYRST
jgi:hypothetical protein